MAILAIIPALLSLFLFFGLWIWQWLHTSYPSLQDISIQTASQPVTDEYSSVASLLQLIMLAILHPLQWLKKEQRQLYRVHSAIQSFRAGKPEKMLRLTRQSLSSHNTAVWNLLRREIALQREGAMPLEKMEQDILDAMDVLQQEQDKTALLTALSKVLAYRAWSLNFVQPGSVDDANTRHQMGIAYAKCVDLSSQHIAYLEAAFDCYHYALEIYQALHSDKEYIVTLCHVGQLYLNNIQSCVDQVGRMQLALHYYECAVQACSTDIPLDVLAQTYYASGNAYYIAYEVIHEMRYLKNAYATYKKALAIYDQHHIQIQDDAVISEIKGKVQYIESIR